MIDLAPRLPRFCCAILHGSMGIRFTVDHATKIVVAVAEGPVRFGDIRTHLLEERSYQGLPYSEILDARNAIPEVTSNDVRAIVELLQELHRENKLGPTAIIVGSELAFGMARMLEILTDDICAIRPFWNFDEAATWLQDLRAESKP